MPNFKQFTFVADTYFDIFFLSARIWLELQQFVIVVVWDT